MSEYPWRILDSSGRKKYAVLTLAQGVPDYFERFAAVPLAHRWPADAVIHMDAAFRKNLALADIHGAMGSFVVSQRFVDLVRTMGEREAEFLPIAIIDHKGKPVPEPYYLLNGTRVVDCIDLSASDVRWNVLAPTEIAGTMRLVLDPAKLPRDGLIIRPHHLRGVHLFREELAAALDSAGATGIYWFTVEEYGG